MTEFVISVEAANLKELNEKLKALLLEECKEEAEEEKKEE